MKVPKTPGADPTVSIGLKIPTIILNVYSPAMIRYISGISALYRKNTIKNIIPKSTCETPHNANIEIIADEPAFEYVSSGIVAIN